MKSVICYARVSSFKQSSGLGIDAQVEEMKRFAQANNLNIVDIRTETASGKLDLERRPVLQKAFEDAEKMEDCFVLTAKLDRLSRRSTFIHKISDEGRKFIVAECGVKCGTLELAMRAAFAQEEREKIGARTKAAFAAKKARGEAMGMHLKSIALHGEKARLNSAKSKADEADGFAQYMRPQIEMMQKQGMSLNKMADYLNSYNFPTARGGKTWYGKSISNIISRWK